MKPFWAHVSKRRPANHDCNLDFVIVLRCFLLAPIFNRSALVSAISGPPFGAFLGSCSKRRPANHDCNLDFVIVVRCFLLAPLFNRSALVSAISGPPFKAFLEPFSDVLLGPGGVL